MAKTDATSEQLAAALTKIADLEARLAFVEAFKPIADARAALQRESEGLARIKRANAITNVAEYDALAPGDRKQVRPDTFIAILRNAKRADRQRVVASLEDRWRIQATVAFALAPAPKLVEVTSHRDFEITKPVPLADEETADKLDSLGLTVTWSAEGKPRLAAFNMAKGEQLVLDAATWEARCEFDERLRGWIAEGKVSARNLSDEEARQHALSKYMEACRDAETPQQVERLKSQLPRV